MNMHQLKNLIPLLLIISLLSSCAAIGAIFKAGVWVGIIIIAIIVAIILWVVNKLNKK